MITICLTYYRSLGLANLAAALYSVWKQDLSFVESIVVVDNNTVDSRTDIQSVIDRQRFEVPVWLASFKHGDSSKTHSWSTNKAVGLVTTPWILFTRADYLLDFGAAALLAKEMTSDNRFLVSRYYDVRLDIEKCEQTTWRDNGPQVLQMFGSEFDHTLIDSGVWACKREMFDKIGGMDETLTAWGHAQTEFQHRLYMAGAEFVRVPHVLFYHPVHGYETPRDHDVAKRQLEGIGHEIKDLWKRYEGLSPY